MRTKSNLLRCYTYGSNVFYDLTLSESDLRRLSSALPSGDRLKGVLDDTAEDGLDELYGERRQKPKTGR